MKSYTTPKIVPQNILHDNESLYLELKPARLNFFAIPILIAIFAFVNPVMLVVAIIAFAVSMFLYSNKFYVLTDKRILVIKGVINKYRFECPLSKIQNINLKIPFASGNAGTISFDTASGPLREVEWVLVKNPREIYNKVSSVVHQ
jgi:uncharacterized membrane protein YdbT with pleckstrin-like domain